MAITILGVNTKVEFDDNVNKFIYWTEINHKEIFRQTLIPFLDNQLTTSNIFAVKFDENRYDIIEVEIEKNKSYEDLISAYISVAK